MSNCNCVGCQITDWHERLGADLRCLGHAISRVSEEAGDLLDCEGGALWRGPAIVGLELDPIEASRNPERAWHAGIDGWTYEAHGRTAYAALAAAWSVLLDQVADKEPQADLSVWECAA
jgi:hypothetical protein